MRACAYLFPSGKSNTRNVNKRFLRTNSTFHYIVQQMFLSERLTIYILIESFFSFCRSTVYIFARRK